jgi:hypothetical protein
MGGQRSLTIGNYDFDTFLGRAKMAARKTVMIPAPSRPELDRLLENARKNGVTDEQLMEQRASFAYGNAPEGSRITKESARTASQSVRLIHA